MRATPRTVSAALLVAMCAGCGTSAPTHFHVLDEPELEAVTQLRAVAWVGVGPITLPGYLDRPQMVTRSAATDVQVNEFHQWAEPLQESFVRALSADLSRLLDTNRVYTYPWDLRHSPDYSVAIDVTRFEAAADRTLLRARWTLVGGPEHNVVVTKRFQFEHPVDAGDYAAVADGLSDALVALSREIATAIVAAEK